MGSKIVRLKSSEDIYLLADGLDFKIAYKDECATDTIDEKNSRRIIALLNGGIETEKIIRRIKNGEKLDILDKTVSIPLYAYEYSTSNFMQLIVIVNDINRETWTGSVVRDEGSIKLTRGVLRDILSYLLSVGIKPKSRSYYIIKYVDALPITSRTDIAWMLTADFGDKKAGTVWRWDSEKWCPVEDHDDEDPYDHIPDDVRGSNFIISEDEPESLKPGDVWGKITPIWQQH